MTLIQAEAILDQAAGLVQGPGASALDWRELVDWVALLRVAGRVAVILLLAWLAFRLLGALLRRIERSAVRAAPGALSAHESRVRTLLDLVRSVGVVVILVIALFMVLGAVGVNIGPLLAGAGVVGLAISFGAQSLVKDVISGLFIVVENQFGIGDVIRVGDASGRVERMTLRIVVLRDALGAVHIIPNGEVTRVTNMTRAFSRAILDIGVSYREDADRVMEVMREVGRELGADPAWGPLLVEPVEVPGIESFADAAVHIRMVATTVPARQGDVARELRRRLKKRFEEEGIEMPVPPRVTDRGAPADGRQDA